MRSTNGRTLKSEMSECLLLSSGDSIPHLPGVNRLNVELKNEENSLNTVRRLPIDGKGQIGLHADSVTAISSATWADVVTVLLRMLNLRELNRL